MIARILQRHRDSRFAAPIGASVLRAQKGRAMTVVDLTVLTTLVGDDPAVIDRMLEAFRSGAAQSMQAIEQGIVAGRLEPVAAAAHSLKSGARAIGARRLGDLCEDIEDAAVARRADALSALLPRFEAERAAVCNFLDSR